MTTRTLSQAVEDWFLNSPGWPFMINVDEETDDFMRDGSLWLRDQVRSAISEFAIRQRIESNPPPPRCGNCGGVIDPDFTHRCQLERC